MKTRKQIIELIEPYMDKILSEGCLLTWGKIINNNLDVLADGDILLGPEIEDEEILGHYDITAVLKYIDKYNFGSIRITEYEIVTSVGDKNACIPNKPLHLYTEEENKYLLGLLKKLGQTNR